MADEDDVLAAFQKAYYWFNKHDFTEATWNATMDGLLHPAVKMKRLDDPGYHDKPAIKDYFLKGNGKTDQATFNTTDIVCQTIGGLGFVSGFADFVDKDGVNHNPPSHEHIIAFSFTYTKMNGAWTALHLWGAYIA
jgi:hypothetical protein